MNLPNKGAVLAIVMLGLASLTAAQPNDGPEQRPRERDGAEGRGVPKRSTPQTQGPSPHQPEGYAARGAGPERKFNRGDRLPKEFRARQYVVHDWRAHRLSAPPRGHQWVRVGSDFVLIATATGVIASLIVSP